MRFFFRGKPEPMWPKEHVATDARRDVSNAPTSDAQSIVAALRALAERIGARRKPESASHDSGPRTLAEINAAGAKLWPRRLPLPLASGRKNSEHAHSKH